MISLGLENLHRLTNNKKAKLRIDIEAFRRPRGAQGTTAYALYDKFWVGSESTQYTLEEIVGYTGQLYMYLPNPNYMI